MEPPSNGRKLLRFGLFEADLSSGELYKCGRLVHLQDQPFRVLSILLVRPGEVVSREELRKELWPSGTYVEFDEGLDTAVKKLRYALGDSAQTPMFVETIPRRGYRFIAQVTGNGLSNPGLPAISVPAPVDAAREAPSLAGGAFSSRRVRGSTPRRSVALKYAAAITAVVLATVVFRFHKPSAPLTRSDLRLRQLTINSVENAVTSGAISPDGRFLAFVDAKGIHIQLVETGEGRTVPRAESLKSESVEWEIPASGWFPDSLRFLANAHPAGLDPSRWSSETSSIWLVSLLGGAPRKLRENAIARSVSPDGSSISFAANGGRLGDREIWLMGPTGEQAHKLFDTYENSSIGRLNWSADGQKVIYVRTDESGESLVSRDVKGGRVTTLLPPSELKNVTDASWLPDGRLIYSVRESQPVGDTCNYWTMRLDAGTGQTLEKPRLLTNWAGFCLNYTSVTKDGKRLAFQESAGHDATYLAELDAGGRRIRNPKHFTSQESEDVIADWTADSKTVILVFNRGDNYGLYRQALGAETPEPIVTSAAGGLLRSAVVSPDGKWVILEVYSISGGPAAPTPLMRVPLTGGSPELIFAVSPGTGFTCARPPSDLCVLAEPSVDRKQLTFTAFDPVHGQRGPEIARLDRDPNLRRDAWPLCALSPDGTRLAASRGAEGPIQVLSLRGLPRQVIRASDLKHIRLIGWTGDGKGLFVINGIKDGTALMHVDLHGNTQVLWRCGGQQRCDFTPSPDGHYLAIFDRELSANLWMMENF